ncbi:26S proteasome non-ATPase regulatory subunit 1-like [Corticium candelabrum]|uniref:26S proteasome non-ATPase regulatory subunit 1-like n=1 Tax=Corticium candelabrum TaxID=121492 RepID=UPI002E25FF06|nr:26S proteasome non-ATPase regulatory subunit 1-like [Corticium candelabrum]
MTLTSAAGILALLDDPEPELKGFALQNLNAVVHDFWAEIAESVSKLEELSEDEEFQHRELSALVVSKVYYHLGGFDMSRDYALGAGSLFDISSNSEYVETIVAQCIDEYTKLHIYQSEHPADDFHIDYRLEAIVHRMFERCFKDQQYKQAVGIALETRHLDVFERAIRESEDVAAMLDYSFKVCLLMIQSREFRNQVLECLVNIYLSFRDPNYVSICQCYIFLDNTSAVAELLLKLISGSKTDHLVAYQIAFDMYESATQHFLSEVTAVLQSSVLLLQPDATSSLEAADNDGQLTKKDEQSEGMETDAKQPEEQKSDAGTAQTSSNDPLKHRVESLLTILGGETTISLHQDFLIRKNNADLAILKNTKEHVRNSISHTATVISNAYMHCGTTVDTFLRSNLDWFAKASNWARFTATASLGVIHRGHEKESLNLMSTYLPKDSGVGGVYTEGGGLFALGLIHVNHGSAITEYLINQLKETTSDVVRHGGCLGLGLAALGTARNDVYEQLKLNLYQDDAVTGEAAGLAMGLVMVGSSSPEAIDDMVKYSKETQHEKILRGLAVGIALTMYGRLEEADTLIEVLSSDKDPLLRRSGMYTIGMAYCGSGNNKALKQLLHVAVSDVDNDVRRAAVTSVGFILFRTPEQCPGVVSLLAESYNPHVRCGAALALGIACAGTGLRDAVSILEPMTNDPVNFVRQAVFIASAMVLMQHTEAMTSKVKTFRDLYSKAISDKLEDIMARFGAILAQGIIDAGGRNVTISLQSRTGHTHMMSVVGTLVFTQFWYWFPMAHFLSLAFTPTAIIGLNSELKMPKLDFCSSARPSLYAYPAPLQAPKEKEREKVATAVLSITAKARAKAKKAEEGKSNEAMDTDQDAGNSDAVEEAVDKVEEKEKDKEIGEEKEKEPEPLFEMLANPARVIPVQLRVLSMPSGSRYEPLKLVNVGGVIMLSDKDEEQPQELVESLPDPIYTAVDDEGPEPDPPEPFEYIED